MTDLISDFREQSVKNELEDTVDLLEIKITRQYFCHKRERKVQTESHHGPGKTQLVNSKVAVQECEEIVDS